MPADKATNPFGFAPAPGRAGAEAAPMFRAADGKWTMELTGEGLKVEYERAGGIVHVTATALVRHAQGDERQPVVIVLREEDAKPLGGRIVGSTGSIL